jgi:hypothetical protein
MSALSASGFCRFTRSLISQRLPIYPSLPYAHFKSEQALRVLSKTAAVIVLMPSDMSAQRNKFLGSISNERGLFMAGAQLNTGGGNITIIGGRGDDSRLPVSGSFGDGAGGGGGGASRLREREGLCLLSFGESARAFLVRGGGQVEGRIHVPML